MIYAMRLPWLAFALARALRSELAAAATDAPYYKALRSEPAAVADAPYNEAEALTYLHYAQAAFCERCPLTRWDCGVFCNKAPIVPGTLRHLGPGTWSHVTGYVAEMPGGAGVRSCIVAFRGSSHIMHWIADARFRMSKWPPEPDSGCAGCAVHSGFAQGFGEIERGLVDAIRGLGCQKISVAGYSLGAAIAALAAYRARTTLGLVADPVYLFGAPRVGNAAFAESFVTAAGDTTPPAWRIIHARDPVPRSPPDSRRLGGYRHFPREVYYTDSEDAFRACNAKVGEDPGCARMVPLVMCMLHLHQHSTYFNVSSTPTECIVQSSRRDCARPPGTQVCECDVVFRRGPHSSFSDPARKAWETRSLRHTSGEACRDDVRMYLSLPENSLLKDAKCSARQWEGAQGRDQDVLELA